MKVLTYMGFLASACLMGLVGCGGGGGDSVIGDAIGSSKAEIEEQLPAQKIVFTRKIEDGLKKDRSLVTYKWGEQTLPAHSSVGKAQDFIYSIGRIIKTNEQLKTQYANFTFESKGIFTTNPNFHFAVILKHEGTGRWNRGRGFIVGNLDFNFNSGDSGCGPGMTSTPETWFVDKEKASNTVFGANHCGSPLNDNQKYKVEMSSGDDNTWKYEIKDMQGNIVGGSTITDSYKTNPEKDLINTDTLGFAIGVVFADNHNAPFELVFDNLELGWK